MGSSVALFPAVCLFLYLQLMDILTTLIAANLGAQEGSPFVLMLMRSGPAIGVLISKMVAVTIAAVCYRIGRPHLIRWINVWFAVVVAWNALVILQVLSA